MLQIAFGQAVVFEEKALLIQLFVCLFVHGYLMPASSVRTRRHALSIIIP